jgi:hypothetical protein
MEQSKQNEDLSKTNTFLFASWKAARERLGQDRQNVKMNGRNLFLTKIL